MLNLIDNLLNRITMYRLMLYFLLLVLAYVTVLGFFQAIPFSAKDILYTFVLIYISARISNWIFSKILKIPINYESASITALILTFIVTPGPNWVFLVLVAIIAQASKYVLAFRGKHIFNPAAIAVIISAIFMNQGASWWIGSVYTLPLIVAGGLLIARKVQRFDLIFSFLFAHLITLAVYNRSNDVMLVLQYTIINSALLFFTFIMLIEPLTSPGTRKFRLIYGAIVGILMGVSFNIGKLYSSPELALIIGNIFAFWVSDRARYKLKIISKTEVADGIFDFTFEPNYKPKFLAGQYMDWTLKLDKMDSRGNRRYFTIASSPTENKVKLGVRFYDPSSQFKIKLRSLHPGDMLLGGQISGDFVLPVDRSKKLVFIAGGIGITPFRSMLKYLLDKKDRRDIVLFYANYKNSEIAFKDVLSDAEEKLGAKIIHILNENHQKLDEAMIGQYVQEIDNTYFYISGSRGMVTAFEKILKNMGVKWDHIKMDFFPGYV